MTEKQQLDIFNQDNELRLETKFRDFHADNPQVYKKLVEMSRDLKLQGHNKIGIQMLFEVIRWQTMLQTTDQDFKMNNSYASRYARLIMVNELDLDNMFEIRRLQS